MSHSIHSNQMSVFLVEHQNQDNNQSLGSAVCFLEEVDYEAEALRLKRRWRAQRAAGSIAGFMTACALFAQRSTQRDLFGDRRETRRN